MTQTTETDQNEPWYEQAMWLIKDEIRRQRITYLELSSRMAEIGIEVSESNIATKLNRGKFSAAFMLQCFQAMGVKIIRLGAEPEQ